MTPHSFGIKYDVARSKSHSLYQLETSKGAAPLVSTPIRCGHSDTGHTDDSIQIGRRRLTKGKPRVGKCARGGRRYLWVMVKTPSQPEGGSSKRYSWQRFQ